MLRLLTQLLFSTLDQSSPFVKCHLLAPTYHLVRLIASLVDHAPSQEMHFHFVTFPFQTLTVLVSLCQRSAELRMSPSCGLCLICGFPVEKIGLRSIYPLRLVMCCFRSVETRRSEADEHFHQYDYLIYSLALQYWTSNLAPDRAARIVSFSMFQSQWQG